MDDMWMVRWTARYAFAPAEKEIAMATARSRGAIGAKAVVPALVKEMAGKDDSILDFGCGPGQRHVRALRAAGFRDVTGYDFGEEFLGALDRRYQLVYASNVINVCLSEAQVRRTLMMIKDLLRPDGTWVVNYPSDPRKAGLTVPQVRAILEDEMGGANDMGIKTSAVWFGTSLGVR